MTERFLKEIVGNIGSLNLPDTTDPSGGTNYILSTAWNALAKGVQSYVANEEIEKQKKANKSAIKNPIAYARVYLPPKNVPMPRADRKALLRLNQDGYMLFNNKKDLKIRE